MCIRGGKTKPIKYYAKIRLEKGEKAAKEQI